MIFSSKCAGIFSMGAVLLRKLAQVKASAAEFSSGFLMGVVNSCSICSHLRLNGSVLSASSPVHHNLEMHEGAGKHIVTTVRRALGDNADTSFLHHDGNGTGVGESKDGNGHANNGNGHNTSHTPNHGQNKAHSLIAESPVIDRDTAKAISALVVEEKVAAGVLPEHELRALEMKNKPKKKPFEFRG